MSLITYLAFKGLDFKGPVVKDKVKGLKSTNIIV